MPNSPNVHFTFENRNVEVSTPSLGVSHVVARTTKGEPFKPDIVINSLSQFEEVYGKEVGLSSGLSNIEVALKAGSKVRVARVLGSGYSKGLTQLAKVDTGALVTETSDYSLLNLIFMNDFGVSSAPSDTQATYFSIVSKQYGGSFTPEGATQLGAKVHRVTTNGITSLYLSAYSTKTVASMTPDNLVATYLVARFKSSQGSYFDTEVFRDFINRCDLFDIKFQYASQGLTHDPSNSNVISQVATLDDALEFMSNWSGNIVPWIPTGAPYALDNTLNTDGKFYYLISDSGSAGGALIDVDWYRGFEALLDYTDGYQLLLSNLSSSLPSTSDQYSLYKSIKDVLEVTGEIVLYIDVPLRDSSNQPMEYDDTISWVSAAVDVIGGSRYVAYFAGGYKYISPRGNLQESSNGGTVLGLGDTSASNYGPWLHFSGQNRGLVLNARGIVSPNYGSPANITKLNLLANSRVNISAVRATPSYGQRVMLLHNFTSSTKTDSYRYLGVVRLTLYLKKTLRPLLNTFLEEPNTFSTWQRMFYTVKPVMDDLVNKSAITSDWDYQGDQFATSYNQLAVNNEADVRQGKYRAIIKFKEVVALQEILFEMIMDAASGNVEINPL